MNIHFSNWNAGKVFGCAQVVIAVGASVGYFYARDLRRGFYWMFVACVEATISW